MKSGRDLVESKAVSRNGEVLGESSDIAIPLFVATLKVCIMLAFCIGCAGGEA